MKTCHHCGANLLPDKPACDFCEQPVSLQLGCAAESFIREHKDWPRRIGRTALLRSLVDARVLRRVRVGPLTDHYEWTHLGRMLAQDLAA